MHQTLGIGAYMRLAPNYHLNPHPRRIQRTIAFLRGHRRRIDHRILERVRLDDQSIPVQWHQTQPKQPLRETAPTNDKRSQPHLVRYPTGVHMRTDLLALKASFMAGSEFHFCNK